MGLGRKKHGKCIGGGEERSPGGARIFKHWIKAGVYCRVNISKARVRKKRAGRSPRDTKKRLQGQ